MTTQYGVRGPDPRNTVVTAPSKDAAVDMLTPGDVLMVKEGACPHTNACRCAGGWRVTADCKNCGQEITTWHPRPFRPTLIPAEWTHVAYPGLGGLLCWDRSGNYAEPKEG
jgi:hypothetical protein